MKKCVLYAEFLLWGYSPDFPLVHGFWKEQTKPNIEDESMLAPVSNSHWCELFHDIILRAQ